MLSKLHGAVVSELRLGNCFDVQYDQPSQDQMTYASKSSGTMNLNHNLDHTTSVVFLQRPLVQIISPIFLGYSLNGFLFRFNILPNA